MCAEIIRDFDALPITDERKPRVGIVGEILVKYAPAANNHLVDLLEKEGAEVEVPNLMGFMLYCFYNQIFKAKRNSEQASVRHGGAASASTWCSCFFLRSTAPEKVRPL
jgi:predicted nucleotide-binding protein (sugar kinase/HSP70/actin superfamily)